MKYFLAVFIFISTVSDPWIDMLRSGELGKTDEIHFSVDQTGLNAIDNSLIATEHDHQSPCSADDCADCHSCHLGHCGLLIPTSLVAVRNASIFVSTLYITQIPSVSLDGLYRPPKTII